MKTKITLRAMATIAASLMMISLFIFSGRTVRADGSPILYELNQVIYYSADGNASSREIYTYNDCEYLVSYVRQNMVEGLWVNVRGKTYDESGNLLMQYDVYTNRVYYYNNTYDANGNRLTALYQYYKNGVLMWSDRTTSTYDGNGNKTEEIHEIWDSGSASWEYSSKTIMTYDGNSNMLTTLTQIWDGVFWVNNSLETCTYDGNNNILTSLLQIWDGVSWVNDYLETSTYNEDGLMLSNLAQGWDGMTWYDIMTETWAYDESGNKLTYEMLYPLYEYGERQTRTYDAAGNWLTLLNETYEGIWANSNRHTRQFDPDGNLSYYLLETWRGGVINNWVNDFQQIYEYNDDGNCTLYYNHGWNWTYPDYLNGYWKNNERVEYEYMPGMISGQGFRDDGSGGWVEGVVSYVMEYAMNIEGSKKVFLQTGGFYVEVYYITGLTAEASLYQTVYYGYPPQECATVSVTAGGGVEPYTYLWDNGETTASFEVCPLESTAYSVTVTDAAGCTATASARVCVIDVRCGNNMDKVMLCHYPPDDPENPQTLCLAQASVPAHLAHGDLLGVCGEDYTCTDLKAAPTDVVIVEPEEGSFLRVYPNPAGLSTLVSYLVDQPGKVTIRLANFLGQSVNTVFEGDAPGGEVRDLQLNTAGLQPGVYVLILQQANGNMIMEKMVIQR